MNILLYSLGIFPEELLEKHNIITVVLIKYIVFSIIIRRRTIHR
jgi:hypothetical protein